MRAMRLLTAVIGLTSIALGHPVQAQPAPDEQENTEPTSPEPAEDPATAGPAPEPFRDPNFGPAYAIEQIVVRGNRKTATALIKGEVGVVVGDVLTASDGRVEAARIHLLSLGFFLDVRLALERGSQR